MPWIDGVVPPATRHRPFLAGATIIVPPQPILTVDVVGIDMVPLSAWVPVHAVLVPYSNRIVGEVPTTVAWKLQTYTAVVPLTATNDVVPAAPLMFTAFGSQFLSLSPLQPIAALPLQIYVFALSPYDDWHRLAWAGSLVLIVLIVFSVSLVRFVTSRGVLKGNS